MLHVVKEEHGDVLLVKFSGSIEENVDFTALLGTPSAPKMDLVLKEVLRINSIGVKAWIRYFSAAVSKGVQIRLFECSTAIVEQVNLISNFACGGTVESMYLPFCCATCGTELLGLFRTADLKRIKFAIPDLKCSKCGGTASFDDIPEEYFGFMTRG